MKLEIAARNELDAWPRGAGAAMARKYGVSRAHITQERYRQLDERGRPVPAVLKERL